MRLPEEDGWQDMADEWKTNARNKIISDIKLIPQTKLHNGKINACIINGSGMGAGT